MPAPSAVEWFEVEPGKVVVATSRGASLHALNPLGGPDPFASPMTGPGSRATTRNLLDGILGFVQRSYRTNEPRPPLTPLRWVWRLAGYYHSTTHTSPLMARVAEKFEAGGHELLGNYARLKEWDEAGHDVLALQDLRNMGYPAEEVVKVLHPPTAKLLVDYFRATVEEDYPIGAVGYTYAVERLAISVTEAYIEEVEEMLGPGIRATHCLRVHSEVGADVSVPAGRRKRPLAYQPSTQVVDGQGVLATAAPGGGLQFVHNRGLRIEGIRCVLAQGDGLRHGR